MRRRKDASIVMHDTISTDETPQNENAASRSNTL